MVDAGGVTQQAIDDAVEAALAGTAPGDQAAPSRLARAVVAERLSAVAHHRARDEVAAAQAAGSSWEDIGHAFGMSPENARQHFGEGPAGLPE